MISTECQGAAGRPVRMDLHLPEAEGPHPVVVVCHGFKGFRNWGFFPEITHRLAAAGFAAIRIDLSHNGVGSGDEASDFVALDLFEENRPSYEIHDLNAVIDAVKTGLVYPEIPLRRDRFGFLGHSRGGAAVMLTAMGRDDIEGLATWAAVDTVAWSDEARQSVRERGYWEVLNGRTNQLMRVGRAAVEESEPMPPELDLERAASWLGHRLLLVHGDADPAVPVQAAKNLHRWSGEKAGLLVIETADHVFGCRHPFAGATPLFEQAIEASIAHLRTKLS